MININPQFSAVLKKNEKRQNSNAEHHRMSISAKDVMALRGRTGLGMMDCKQALIDCNGNQDAAEEIGIAQD